MNAIVVLRLDLDSKDAKEAEFQLRTALCLMAHPDCSVQPRNAKIQKVVIESVIMEGSQDG